MKVLGLLLLLIFSTGVYADPVKVVYHLNEREKASVLVSSINELLRDKKHIYEIHAIIHGSAIMKLSKDDSMRGDFESLLNNGVTIGACNIAMMKRGLKHEMLLGGVKFLEEGGIKEILKLQYQGFKYIKI